jgi:hypothetical protein
MKIPPSIFHLISYAPSRPRNKVRVPRTVLSLGRVEHVFWSSEGKDEDVEDAVSIS